LIRARALAPAKVNLCLFLGGTRADGRHQLVTVFESVSLADELVLETLPSGPDQVVCDGVEGRNLVADALAGLRSRGWTGPPIRIEIDKRIPVAAGMAGGSADAAAALRMARSLAPFPTAALTELAAQLGADVPGQLEPGVALGTGAGERVDRRGPLAPHAFTILPLAERLSTAEVYAEADRLGLARAPGELEVRLRELERALEPGARLPDSLLVNDLQAASISLCPQIESALDALWDVGAEQVLVCGSGPTVAGLHWGDQAPDRAADSAAALGALFPAATAVVPASSPASGTIRAEG
jgi:4-diphosphocytidyl-2-C-methyl-D-erythritol kinase